jgi:outer membrane protein assembly factor BamB
MPLRSLIIFCFIATIATQAFAQHMVLVQGNDRLAIVDKDGEIGWEMEWDGIHDIHYLPNGNIMVQKDMRQVVEIDIRIQEVIWTYDATIQNGNEGKRVEVHAFQPLANGNIMIAESGPARIIEIDRKGNILKNTPLKVDNPHPHRDTRLARKIDNGNYLVCHEADGAVREYDSDTGDVVWSYEVPMFGKEAKGGHGPEAFGNALFSAVRLPNGNTLIGTGNGHSVLEVTPTKEIVWELHQNDLPGITLAWVTTLEVLPNGNYVIGNCHAGPGQPLLIEIDPKTRKVLWTFDQYDTFGNSVPNTQLLDLAGKTIR